MSVPGSVKQEALVLQQIMGTVLTSLIPSLGVGNVYLPAPEMPSGSYEGTYPYVTVALDESSVTGIEAGGGPVLRTEDSSPNLYTVTLVDQLVSESGQTLNATELFLLDFIDATNSAFAYRPNQSLTDSGGVPRATSAGLQIRFARNPRGTAEMMAGAPSIVCAGTVSTLSLPIYSRSTP